VSDVKQYTVDAEDDDIRLDRWVKRRMPQISFTLLAKWTRTGQVRLDGKRCEPSDRVSTGSVIRLPPMDLTPAEEHFAYDDDALTDLEIADAKAMVMHRDDACIVLNKPPGLATQGGSGTFKHVDRLLSALMFDRSDKPRLVHRLDKDTSGVLLLARSAKSAAFFSEHFRGRTAAKLYWALVVGVPDIAEGTITAPLAKQPGTGGEKMHVDTREGQSAKTQYRMVERAGNSAAWLEMKPLTGRTHQLRVHAKTIGHPIVGDAKYGGVEAFLTGGISRKMHLHAHRLVIPHPNGKLLDIKAPMPQHMKDSWKMLGFDISEADDTRIFDPQDVVKEALAKPERLKAKETNEQRRKIVGEKERVRNTRRGARRAVKNLSRPKIKK
jgi:23S rRNA pseudouridine955/2504/2580 synthase